MSVKVIFRGGAYDGLVWDVDFLVPVMEIPRIQLSDDYNHAVPIKGDDVKRQSWDEEALTITTIKYRNTGEEIDGAVVFESLPADEGQSR